MPDIQGQLVLAQNQHAFIQDSTKGTVQVYAGPHALALSGNDKPVVYDNTLEAEAKRVAFFADKFKAITPDLVQAMMTLGQTDFATKLSAAIAPLAINEQNGLGQTLERIFKGTGLETVLENLQKRPAKAGGRD